MADALAKIAAVADVKARTEQYKQLIADFVSGGKVAELNAAIDHLVQDSVPLAVSRQVVTDFAEGISKLSKDNLIAVGQHALKALHSHITSFEEHYSTISEKLATVFRDSGKFRAAADLLAGIPLDSGQRVIDEKYKANIYVQTAECYLRDSAWQEAEKAVNRASALEKDPALNFRFRVCFATVLDFKRKYLDVVRHYYELARMVDNDEARMKYIDQAIAVAILSEAGPQRSRWLSVLHKDEFAPRSALYGFLNHVFMDRVLRSEEVTQFASHLKPHHIEKRTDGFSDLDLAMVQHNLLAASRIYNNITFEQMGGLLQIAPEKAEKVAAQMIMDRRLLGSIDQISGLVTFDASRNTLPLWDQQIEGTCYTLERIVTLIGRAHPAMVAGL